MAQSKFGRPTNQRRALLRGLATAALKNERITTTEAKAKAVKPVVEKLITLGKKGDLHARRQVLSYVLEEDVVTKLFEDIAPRYAERNGGYTRIYKASPRRGDGAPQAILELV
ncbi:MAG: 50S ribosomal protein L17 [Firmicutes bacterium]|nr:50S ribosomal protein L17 [Bacillota bacterium]